VPIAFQSTRPHGARHPCYGYTLRLRHVSIHAPARGATPRSQSHSLTPKCFNPRARTGRDTTAPNRSRVVLVSIHAPARGATLYPVPSDVGAEFQSTRPHGARHPHSQSHSLTPTCFNPRARTGRDTPRAQPPRLYPCFNPRARTGRDFEMRVKVHIAIDVSIHAPARGATAQGAASAALSLFQSTRPHGARRPAPCSSWRCSRSFNPRARTGRDTTVPVSLTMPSAFQSTRPHGARRMTSSRASGCESFNPRARTGRDAELLPSTPAAQVSIHAPARGATGSAVLKS